MIILDSDPSPRHWEAAHLPEPTKGGGQKELRDDKRVGNQCKIKVSGWMEAELVALKEDTVWELLYVSIRFYCSILEGMHSERGWEVNHPCPTENSCSSSGAQGDVPGIV